MSVAAAQRATRKAIARQAKLQRAWLKGVKRKIDDLALENAARGRADLVLIFENDERAKAEAEREIAIALGYRADLAEVEYPRWRRFHLTIAWGADVLPTARAVRPRKWWRLW